MLLWKGGPGSGFKDHAGRKGRRGGSLPKGSAGDGYGPSIEDALAGNNYRQIEGKVGPESLRGRNIGNANKVILCEFSHPGGSFRGIRKIVDSQPDAWNELFGYKLGKELGVRVPETVKVGAQEVRQKFIPNLKTFAEELAEADADWAGDFPPEKWMKFKNVAAAAHDFVMHQIDRNPFNFGFDEQGEPIFFDNGNTNSPDVTAQRFSIRMLDRIERNRRFVRGWDGNERISPFVLASGGQSVRSIVPALKRIVDDDAYPDSVRARARYLIINGEIPGANPGKDKKAFYRLTGEWNGSGVDK